MAKTHAAQTHARTATEAPSEQACAHPLEYLPGAPARRDISPRKDAYPAVEALFARLRGQDVDAFVHAARHVCVRPGDVLEYVIWRRSTMGNRQHFPTALRRRLVGLLESFDARSLAEDLVLDRERSLRALELLSYSRFSRSPGHMRTVDALRNGTLRSWASAKEQAYRRARETGDSAPLLGLLAHRPDVLLREVGRLLDTGASAGDILDVFGEAGSVPFATLLTALARVDSSEALERRRRHEEDRLVRRQATALMRTAAKVRRARGGLRTASRGTSVGGGRGTANPSVLTDEEHALVEKLVDAKTRAYWAEQRLADSRDDPAHRELDEANAEVDALTRGNAPALAAIRTRVHTARAAVERAAASVEGLVDELLAVRDTEPADLRPETRELVARALAALRGMEASRNPKEPVPDGVARHDRWALMGLACGCAACDLDDALRTFAALAQECVVVDGVDPRLPPRMWELSRAGYVVDRLRERAAEQVGRRIARLAETRGEAARILRELLVRKLARLETPLRGAAVYLDAGAYDLERATVMVNAAAAAPAHRCVVALADDNAPHGPALAAKQYLAMLLEAQGAMPVETRGEADVVLTVEREHGEDGVRDVREISLIDEGWFVP